MMAETEPAPVGAMTIILIAAAMALALVNLGGGIYELIVTNPMWLKFSRIQLEPGVWRKRFWMSVHTAFELLIVASLIGAWPRPEIRLWLLIALASHAGLRIWSVVDLFQKILNPMRAVLFMRLLEMTRGGREFEQANSELPALIQARRHLLRLPLDLITCATTLVALIVAAD
jgi:hypothetical protein